ncbi:MULTISPECIES: DUF3164 family protein [Enterobacterales]|uniref:Sulfate transporter n=1 Tax=Hafnia alvei ATCC 51873 TaxID=1002364 RepID=G9Y0K5_HAFAL|nr:MULTISPECIES: DUF3164 family protein [Enterobacterales]EHM48884.1 hypothetical protein HMPREF0454_00063 [Hafnia alvei ATCC 51873]MEA1064568.1 DUF3164 family protein [Erwinia sp. HR93]QQE44173.1 DUF3164 family protein [Hafnia alvei]
MSINNQTAVVPEGYMKDRKGRLVPIEQVSDYDREMDAFVRSRVAEAKAESQRIATFKHNSFGDCYAWLELCAEKFGRKLGGVKGNVTFSSFDGSQQIKIAVQDRLTFGPELQVAKDMIDDCLKAWSKGADEKLLTIITDAFDVDKEGKLNTGRIISLRQLNIQDELWQQAMEALNKALVVSVTSTYINFKEQDENGKMVNIPLDIAGV